MDGGATPSRTTTYGRSLVVGSHHTRTKRKPNPHPKRAPNANPTPASAPLHAHARVQKLATAFPICMHPDSSSGRVLLLLLLLRLRRSHRRRRIMAPSTRRASRDRTGRDQGNMPPLLCGSAERQLAHAG
jgi:hypothetical protein